jgi:hypothetical protein
MDLALQVNPEVGFGTLWKQVHATEVKDVQNLANAR